MQMWWCVALWVCAHAARPDVPLMEPRDGELTPAVIQQAIEMEMEDPMLAGLRSAGHELAALCARGQGCVGALWGRRWLLTRASCAAALPLRHAQVLPRRGLAGCAPTAAPEGGAIPVLARFVHPQHAAEAAAAAGGTGGAGGAGGAHDAALLLLAAPAPVPPHANHSRAFTHVPDLERWLEYVPAALPASWDRPPAPARGLDVAALRLTNSPLRLLAAAVLLPVAALLLLFALALRLPAADGIRADLLDHDALEHAQAPSDDDDEKPAAPLDSPTTDRLAFL